MTATYSYIAVILSESSCTAEDYLPLCEETFVLIRASTIDEALQRARDLTPEQHSYPNVYGQTITWSPELVSVGEALQDVFEDGTEMYARFFRNRAAYEQLQFEDFYKDDA